MWWSRRISANLHLADLRTYTNNINAAELVWLFDQLMDHGNDSYAAWQTLYATTEQLDQIEVELLRQLVEYGKCRTRDLIVYFLIAFSPSTQRTSWVCVPPKSVPEWRRPPIGLWLFRLWCSEVLRCFSFPDFSNRSPVPKRTRTKMNCWRILSPAMECLISWLCWFDRFFRANFRQYVS